MISPVKNLKLEINPKGDVTQWFAENPALYARFNLAGHNGIDIVRPHGEPMYAMEDAIIVSTKEEPTGYGMNVRFVSEKPNAEGSYNLWVYAHTSKNLVNVGDRVKEGDLIALMGNTGFVVSGSTPFWKSNPYAGTHLHLGLRKVNILKNGGFSYPGSDIKLQVLDYENGYKGSVDPYYVLANLSKEQEQLRTDQKKVISLATKLKNLLWDKKNGFGMFAKK